MPEYTISEVQPLFVDISVIAREMSLAVGTAYNQVSNGTFPLESYKIGRRRVFKYADLIAWAENLQPASNSSKVTKPLNHVESVKIQRGRGRPIGTTKVELKKLKTKQAGVAI